MQDIFVQSPLGRVHCRATGQGPLLFLMHSAGRSAHEFDALAGLLADRFRVVSWDMPGHGDSDRPRRHVSITDFAEAAFVVANDLAKGPPIMAGGSIGAVLAAAAAVIHADVVVGAILIEMPLSRDQAWWTRNWPMVEQMFVAPDEPEERARSRFRDLTAELASRLRIDRHKAGSHSMIQLLWAGREDADMMQARVSDLTVPALFINGANGVAPEAAALLPRLNPAAALAIIADAGHFPHSDDPAAVATAITEKFAS